MKRKEKSNRPLIVDRLTETSLSILCLALFAASAGICVGAPIYFMWDWLAIQSPIVKLLFLFTNIVVWPVAFTIAKSSLYLLSIVEGCAKKRTNFQKLLRKATNKANRAPKLRPAEERVASWEKAFTLPINRSNRQSKKTRIVAQPVVKLTPVKGN